MTEIVPRGDTAPTFERRLKKEDGTVIDLSSVNDVEFHMRDSNYNTIVDSNLAGNVSVTAVEKGDVEYLWQTGDTDEIGSYHAEFVVEFSDGTFQTFPKRGNYNVEIVEEIND